MTDYLIETESGDLHNLEILRLDSNLISLHSNARGTICMTTTMAQQIINGLRAVLSGQFSRAITETALLLETQESSRRASRSDSATFTPPSKPELDML